MQVAAFGPLVSVLERATHGSTLTAAWHRATLASDGWTVVFRWIYAERREASSFLQSQIRYRKPYGSDAAAGEVQFSLYPRGWAAGVP